MKKIFRKWDSISIKYKLFIITTGLLTALAMIIYIILSSLLPSYYHNYKRDILDNNLTSISQSSKKYELNQVIESLYYLCKTQNLKVNLYNVNGKIIFASNSANPMLNQNNRYPVGNISEDEYSVEKYIFIKNEEYPYKIEMTMPLQPIDEATNVIKNIMPYIMLVALIIGAIGAYIYSNTITKPLIEIIERERKIENNRKDFVATISHELKTPITIISGQLEGMIYNIGKYKDRDVYLKKSYESTQDLKNLVNEMIEVSKSESSSINLKITHTNLTYLVNQIINKQNYFIEEKNINIDLDIKDDIYIYCDKNQIEKAISNIINNAIKYSPYNENLIIKLNQRSTKNSIISNKTKTILEIENTGITIEPKYINEIFKPFYRIEKSRSRKTGGSGLGLYLTSQIFKSHGFNHSIKNKDNSVLFVLDIRQ